MTYVEWKAIKGIRGEDNARIIRNFERSNPELAGLFAKKEQERMRQIMKEPDRMERWKKIATEFPADSDQKARRQREVM